MRVPFIGGAYSAKWVGANAQRCINVYPERNSKDAPWPITLYERPGFRPLVSAPELVVRGLYTATNGDGYAVVGTAVYFIKTDWTLVKLGDLVSQISTPVQMIDNGIDLLLVDGTDIGYQVNLGSKAFSQVNDPTGLFNGATTVNILDTFTIFNMPGSANFGSSLSNSLTFDPTYEAAKANYPGPLIALTVNRHEILLLGKYKSEIWYNAGNAQFPFEELPGASIEHGCIAPYSVATEDINAYWLVQDLQGVGWIAKQTGYQTKRVSNHALEVGWQKSPNLSDSRAYTYQQDGHVFYVLILPSLDQTWVYDSSIGDNDEAWHQRCWTDANGLLHRDRSNCHAFLYGKHIVGDWENGTIYHLDPSYYKDTVAGTDYAITRIRGLPHILNGLTPTPQGMQMTSADGLVMLYQNFVADMQVGEASGLDGSPAQVLLRVSRDKGKTFGNADAKPNGLPGQFQTQEQWQVLGRARDMVFELEWSFVGPGALNGCWCDVRVLST